LRLRARSGLVAPVTCGVDRDSKRITPSEFSEAEHQAWENLD
jgi:hypothetical protein